MLPEQALVKLKELGIQPPLLAKPMYANGEAEGHRMALIHDLPGVEQMVGARGLSGFAPPLMLQPYVDHGGCLFKVCLLLRAVRVHRWEIGGGWWHSPSFWPGS